MTTDVPAPQAAAPAALYQRVKDFVAGKIADGTLKPGDRVPSESHLVTEFGIARMTVNRALRELAQQGKIVRLAGVGTFVAEQKPQSTLLQIANIGDEIRQRGHIYSSEILSLARVTASLDVAPALDLHVGDSVYALSCVHRENGMPVQLEHRFVNPSVVPEFIDQDFTRVTPSEYLLRHVPFDQVEHVVDAILPTREQAALLEMPESQPCLLLTRRTWTSGVPVTLVRCLHPGMRYRLGSRFRPDNASPRN